MQERAANRGRVVVGTEASSPKTTTVRVEERGRETPGQLVLSIPMRAAAFIFSGQSSYLFNRDAAEIQPSMETHSICGIVVEASSESLHLSWEA